MTRSRAAGTALLTVGIAAILAGGIVWSRAWQHLPGGQLRSLFFVQWSISLGREWRWLVVLLVLTGCTATVAGICLLFRARKASADLPAGRPSAVNDVLGDNPIETPSEDVLGREDLVAEIAGEIRNVNAVAGFVIALTGPWGSGKTSLINLVRHELATAPGFPFLTFNPWMFSGTEQLVDAFFAELAAQLRIKDSRLRKLASELQAYGELLSPFSFVPVAGSFVSKVQQTAAVFSKFQERHKESVVDRRNKLSQTLRDLSEPLVVVIDDIDRLQSNKIRDIFRLVRLTANFPNVIYLLAFDRSRVEVSLDEAHGTGRSYLEKIVQKSIDVPAAPNSLLLEQLIRALNNSFGDLGDNASLNEARWPDVLDEIIAPLVRNMRDVRRYASSARGTVRSLAGSVDLVDLLALEAIRLFRPDYFKSIIESQEALTEVSGGLLASSRSPELKLSIERAFSTADHPRDQQLFTAIINRLFPAAQRHIGGANYDTSWSRSWLKERRVAHVDVLTLYRARFVTETLENLMDAEKAFALLRDGPAFEAFLETIAPDRRVGVISALENFEGHFPPDAVLYSIPVLLNALPTLEDRPRGMFAFSVRIVVARVVLRMFDALNDRSAVEAVIDAILSAVATLSSQLEVVGIVGHQENAGHKLVEPQTAARIEQRLVDDIKARTPAALAHEWDLLRLLLWAQGRLSEGERIVLDVSNPELNAKLLTSARSETRAQAIGTRAIARTMTLAWESLLVLYGSDDELQTAVESVEDLAAQRPELAEVVSLARQYLEGWRPPHF